MSFRALLLSAVLIIAGSATATAQIAGPLAVYTLSPGWATFGLALPPSAASGKLRVGALPTQTDVKVRWPNGSIRFAVVSVNVPRAGSYPVVADAAASAATVPATVPPVSVTFSVNGTPHVARLPQGPGVDTWLAGPLVSERRAVVTPGPGGLNFLRVIFDVRTYSTGGHRVDVTVENGLDVANADAVTYDVAIRIGAETAPVFERAAVDHKYLTRWRKVFTTGGVQQSLVQPDVAPFAAAGALPAYLPSVANPSPSLDGRGGSGSGFDILGFGDLTRPMNEHGGRPEIAPYPNFAAHFLVHKKPDQLAYLLRHGELGGSWGIHLREEDGSLPTIDEHPFFWLDRRWRVEQGFSGPRNTRLGADGEPVIPGQGEPGDIAHQPSLAFVPYLLTGDRFFADEVAFWANYTMIGTYPPAWGRNGSEGLLWNNEVRGIGWGLRNLGDAAAYLPDESPLKAYLAAKVARNLEHLDTYGATYASGPLETVFPGRRPEDHEAIAGVHYMWISVWEQSYLAWAIDRVMGHGVVAGFDFSAKGARLRDRIARVVLPLFTHRDWPTNHNLQMPYLLAVGKWNGRPQAEGSQVTYFQTWAQVRDATFCCTDPNTGLSYMARPFQGYYGPEARLLLMILSKLPNVPEAAGRLDYLMKDVGDDGRRMADDLSVRSGWAIAPGSLNGRAARVP
jgi:hypothetical protein